MLKENRKITIILSLFIFGISFFIERLTLNMNRLDNVRSILMYIFAKAFLMLFLVLMISYIQKMVREVRAKERAGYIRLLVFLLILTIDLAALWCTWPGIWIPDATNILHYILNFSTNVFGQGFFTTFMYYMGLMLFPSIVSVIVIQIIIVATIISKICAEAIREKNTFLCVGMCVVELLPPVLYYNLIPMRNSLFAHLMLLMFYEIYSSVRKVTNKKVIVLSFLVALLAVWRFDAILLIILVPLGCVILWRKKADIVKKIGICLLTIAFFIIFKLMLLVNIEDGMELSGRIIMINPLSMMLQEELTGSNLEEDLQILDQFLDLDIVKRNPSAYDTSALYMDGGCLKYDTDKPISDGIKAYADIIINNPIQFVKARWETVKLVETSTFVCLPQSEYPVEVLQVGTDEEKSDEAGMYNVRNACLRDATAIGFYKIQKLWKIVWAVVIIVIGFIVGLIHRKQEMIFISILALIYAAIIFCTVPNVWFMYYIPTYVSGVFVLANLLNLAVLDIKKVVNNRKKSSGTREGLKGDFI